MDDDTIQNCLNEINGAIDDLRANKDKIQGEAPTDFKLMMFGAKDSRVLDFIFSTKLDAVIDKLFRKIMSGDYSDIERICDTVAKAMEALGLGEGAFKGPVSQHLMTNIMNSLNSGCYNITKNNIRKAMIIVSNLKKQGRQIDDREVRKKYYQAVKSLKLTVRLTAKIYRNRAKIAKGLRCAINEGAAAFDCLEPLGGRPCSISESSRAAVDVNFIALSECDSMSAAAFDVNGAPCQGAVASFRITGPSMSRNGIDDGRILANESGTMTIMLSNAGAKAGDVIGITVDSGKTTAIRCVVR